MRKSTVYLLVLSVIVSTIFLVKIKEKIKDKQPLLYTIAVPDMSVSVSDIEEILPFVDSVEFLTERETIDLYIEVVSERYSLDPALLHSVIWHESRYKPEARNKSNTCLGLMQVCPKWHKDRASKLGVTNFMDPYSNILLGADYISELKTKYKDIGLVLMLYNMTHKKAFELYNKGELSWYAKSVLKRANEIRQGVR